MNIKFQPKLNGECVGGECETLAQSVRQSLSHDGFGCSFERDEAGLMRIYTSGRHIGNNIYNVNYDHDAWPMFDSALTDDDQAIESICAQMHKKATRLHDRYDIHVDELTYNDAGHLVAINGSADPIVEMLMAKNEAVLEEFFIGCASCDYYDGQSHQLYLDRANDTMIISVQASDNSWLQRDDGSLIKIHHVSGYCDTPADERYTDGCSLDDYGQSYWLDMIKEQIKATFTA